VDILPAPFDIIVPAFLVAFGQTLVITSTWQLGITGTFLGDYFGILLDEVQVQGFRCRSPG
jgi:phosphatidylethanolamine/phosphatidyl-N-methylethanolamine N-methyltransferase